LYIKQFIKKYTTIAIYHNEVRNTTSSVYQVQFIVSCPYVSVHIWTCTVWRSVIGSHAFCLCYDQGVMSTLWLKHNKVRILCFVDRASLYNLVNKANLVHSLFLVYLSLSIFINLYMFRETMCPSSGEIVVFMRHVVVVILCGWLSGMHSTLHTIESSIQNNKYQVSHKHSCFSWWWARGRPKHVEIRNKNTKKNCAPSWLYLQYN